MLSKKVTTLGVLIIFFAGWLTFDILTKKWAVSEDFRVIRFIGDWFYLTHFQKNEGIAFSIDVPRFLQIGGSSLILIFLLVIGLKQLLELEKRKTLPTIMLGLVLAGGVGNLLERITQGYVVDFIVLKPIPVFNVADVGITIGLAILFVTMLINESIKNKNLKS